VAADYQKTLFIYTNLRDLKKLAKELGLIQRKVQKINQTGLQLNRVRSRTRNIRGTGRNTATGERKIPTDKDGNVLVSKGVERSIKALNKANTALNEYVQKLSKADGAQRGFTGSANKMNTQVSALRDRLKGLSRSNSEYTSTLQAVQRGEQALFQDRNKRLGDQSRTLGSRGGLGGREGLVQNTIKAKDITQSIDGLNNYISRLEVLKNKVNINSREFKLLENRIAEVNIQLNEAQLMGQSTRMPRGPGNASGRFVSLNSPEAFRQRESYQDKVSSVETQRLAIQDKIYESIINQADKLKLINQLDQTNSHIKDHQLRTAKENNIQVDKQLKKLEQSQGSSTDRKKRRDRIISSAAIGAGFPLLFGGGPIQALAGGIGGGLGERFTPGGGFAGSIAATAAIAMIGKAVVGVGELGKALNPFTADINKLTKSVGLAGTAEGERIRLIEQLSGKQEALKVATATLAREIGQGGVQALKTFGKDFQAVANEFNKLLTNLGATLARIINATGIMDLLQTLLKIANKTFKPATKDLQDKFNVTAEAANTIKPLFVGKTEQQEQQIEFLENALRIGEQEAKNRLEISKHYDQIKHTLKNITREEREQLLIEQQQQLNNLNKIDQLKDELRLQTQIKDILAVGMTNAIQGLILGTQTLSQSLSNIAKQLGSIFLNRAFGALFSRILFPGPSIPLPGVNQSSFSTPQLSLPQSGFSTPGLDLPQSGFSTPGLDLPSANLSSYAYGGVVNSPTLGMVGEGGEPEYIIPASKMDGAMARYSAGARGGAVIPGGSGASGTVAGSSGSTIVEYTGPVLNFNGDEYVPKDSVPQIINAAAKQGATLGQSRTLNTLKNSRSSRAKIGI